MTIWLSSVRLTRMGRVALPLRLKDTKLSRGETTAESTRSQEDLKTRLSSTSTKEKGRRQGLCARVAQNQGSRKALAAFTEAQVVSVLPLSAVTRRPSGS